MRLRKAQVFKEMFRYNIQLMRILKSRWKASGLTTLWNGAKINSRHEDETHSHTVGVAMMISDSTAKEGEPSSSKTQESHHLQKHRRHTLNAEEENSQWTDATPKQLQQEKKKTQNSTKVYRALSAGHQRITLNFSRGIFSLVFVLSTTLSFVEVFSHTKIFKGDLGLTEWEDTKSYRPFNHRPKVEETCTGHTSNELRSIKSPPCARNPKD